MEQSRCHVHDIGGRGHVICRTPRCIKMAGGDLVGHTTSFRAVVCVWAWPLSFWSRTKLRCSTWGRIKVGFPHQYLSNIKHGCCESLSYEQVQSSLAHQLRLMQSIPLTERKPHPWEGLCVHAVCSKVGPQSNHRSANKVCTV